MGGAHPARRDRLCLGLGIVSIGSSIGALVARPIFPATNDSLVLSVGGYPQAGIQVRIYSRQTGGTQITDLTYVAADGVTPGSAVPSGVLTSDANGLIPTFAGPDGGATTVWADHGMSGERMALTSGPGAGGGGGSVTYGTTSGTAAEGNDSRITGAAQKSANLSDLANAGTARTNLGLGAAATMSTAGIAADSALTGTFAPGGTAGNINLAQASGAAAGLALVFGG